jgi:hypothetical protein
VEYWIELIAVKDFQGFILGCLGEKNPLIMCDMTLRCFSSDNTLGDCLFSISIKHKQVGASTVPPNVIVGSTEFEDFW